MTIRLGLISLAIAVSLGVAIPAIAYDETGSSDNPSDCGSCHGVPTVSVEATGVARQGPHGGYTTSSRKCAGCHSVHSAPASGNVLLTGPTITDACELCHDGTGGKGVYGAIASRGLVVGAAHRTEVSSVIPGGDPSTGDTSTAVFSGLGGALSCGDCHSPHGNYLVDPFTSDRHRIETDTAGFLSSKLLKRKPNGATTATAEYGSDWCSGCHSGRAAGAHEVINHPVESSATAGFFRYENLQVVVGVDSSSTETGTLGGSNFGYVVPWPRSAGQGAHLPVCQQCHEDGRNVGDVAVGRVSADEAFAVTGVDGSVVTDNPRFQSFPHETINSRLLVESGDDLCTNCHTPQQLK